MFQMPAQLPPDANQRKKLLAQRLAMGSATQFNGAGQPHQNFTYPYLQDPRTMAGLGVVNPASPSDMFAGSPEPGVSAANPAGAPSDASPLSMNPGVSQAPILNTAISAGQGQYGSGGSGFYGGNAPSSLPPVIQDAIIRSLQGSNPQYLPYGSGFASAGTGSSSRF